MDKRVRAEAAEVGGQEEPDGGWFTGGVGWGGLGRAYSNESAVNAGHL